MLILFFLSHFVIILFLYCMYFLIYFFYTNLYALKEQKSWFLPWTARRNSALNKCTSLDQLQIQKDILYNKLRLF